MPREKMQVDLTARSKVPMRRRGADNRGGSGKATPQFQPGISYRKGKQFDGGVVEKPRTVLVTLRSERLSTSKALIAQIVVRIASAQEGATVQS
jgi:hypothetical protein